MSERTSSTPQGGRTYTHGREWTTNDELITIDYMASCVPRKNGLSTIPDALKRLKTYVGSIDKRDFGGAQVNRATCKHYAVRKWQELSYQQEGALT